ncbi:13165_t:CDS:1 [Cetraspora pellucida]|uniref:13165_t:CDS:1 n=1 Tax=Cetraspora pellucida TaxID=1433469 RepID=A0A9N9BGH4_9GLOM|nr:13165_t:CDS:1 [Cetraspora pellucida]
MSKCQSNFFVNRACVFMNSGNDPMIKSQVIDDPQQLIKLPFPPEINSHDLVTLHPDGRVPKTPNAFIIYRKLFVETAHASGYNLPMSIISLMVSKSWEKEPEEVKNEYKRIAREASDYRNELFPKKKSQKKRDQWKTVSFDKPSVRKVRIPKPMKSVNKSTKHKQPKSSTPKIQPTPNNNLLSPKHDDLNDIDINSPIFDLDLFNEWTDFFSNQNSYPSPDLSITSSSDNSPSLNNFDLPIQDYQQIDDDIFNNLLFIGENQSHIYDSQYGLGIVDFTNVNSNVNEISEINSHNLHEILNIQDNSILDNLVNSNDEVSFFPNLLNTATINQDNLNDALIAYEMGFNYPI